jgi:hypothetical protein
MTILSAVDRETISDVSASVGFTSNKIPPTANRVEYAIIQAVGGNVRYAVNGATPSTSLGLRLTQDSTVEVWGDRDLTNFRCIDDSGTATLEVVYMGRTV